MAEQKISADCFTTGFIAGLAHLRVSNLDTARSTFFPQIVNAAAFFEEKATANNLRPRYWFTIDSLHGDAPEVKDALIRAAGRGLIFFNESTLYLNVFFGDANLYLRNLPGNDSLYIEAAKKFLAGY